MSPKTRREVWSEVENGLGSAGRIKILRYLIEHPNRQYTKYGLREPTGLESREIERQIGLLVDMGWVKEFPHIPRTYKIIMEDEIVKQVAEFFQKLRFTQHVTPSRNS